MSAPRVVASSNERTVDSNTMLSRRSMLSTIGVGLVTGGAGCTAETRRRPTPTPLVDAIARVEPGQHEAFEFELDESTWTTVSAHLSDRSVEPKHDGPSVDVVVMTADQYTRFREQRTFEYVGGVSMPDVVNGQVSDALKPGRYAALVDNTSAGTAKPGDSGVTGVVDLEVTTSDSRR